MLDGGPGGDTASYADRMGGTGVTVTLDGQANDGSPAADGGADQVLTEHVSGTAVGDSLTGDSGGNILRGLGGTDTLRGGGGPDRLDGGGGIDALFADDGDDILQANDGVADQFECGAGTDTANLDLADVSAQPGQPTTRGTGAPVRPDCENATVAAHDERPTLRILGARMHIGRAGRAQLPVHCPARVPTRSCRGVVSLATAARTRRALASTTYHLRRGRRTRLILHIPTPALRRLRRAPSENAAAVARERDRTGRPKITLRTVKLRTG